MLLCIAVFLPVCFHMVASLSWVFSIDFFFFFYRRERKDLKDTFLYSDSILSTFPLLEFLTPFPYPYVCFGSEMIPPVLIHLILNWQLALFVGENGTGGVDTFSSLASCLYYWHEWLKAQLLLSFWSLNWSL